MKDPLLVALPSLGIAAIAFLLPQLRAVEPSTDRARPCSDAVLASVSGMSGYCCKLEVGGLCHAAQPSGDPYCEVTANRCDDENSVCHVIVTPAKRHDACVASPNPDDCTLQYSWPCLEYRVGFCETAYDAGGAPAGCECAAGELLTSGTRRKCVQPSDLCGQ